MPFHQAHFAILRDRERWALLAEEWRERNRKDG
jgi:hypothetical protein